MLNILVLLFLTFSAINVNSQCTSYPSNIDYIITGTMQLGLPSQSYADEDYNVAFSNSQTLGTYAQIFYAFAIVGLKTSSGQNFYSFNIEEVYFTNSNTAMKVFFNYNNTNNAVKTQWSQAKVTYLIVSPQFGGITTGSYGSNPGNSYIWATTLQVTPPFSNQPASTDFHYAHSNPSGACGFINTLPSMFGTNCPSDAKVIYHYYIMGFKYDSTSDSTYEFRVSVLGGDGTNKNETAFNAVISSGITPNGPYMTIDDFGGKLKKIKIGVVLTVLRDYSSYPTQGINNQTFKYSGLFMPVSTFNSIQYITKSSTQNFNYYDIGFSKYKFYGFSSLSLRPNGGSVDFNLNLIDLYTFRLDTVNTLSSVVVSGDIYTKDISMNCSSSLVQKYQVRSEQYTSIPASAPNQQSVTKISSSNGILPDATNQYVFNILGSKTTDSNTIIFTVQIIYENLNAGLPHMIQLAFNQISANDLPNGFSIRYNLAINGTIIFTKDLLTTSNEDDVINKFARTIPNTAAVITITISFSRSLTQDIHFHLNLAFFQISNVYDPVNQCCSLTCPSSTGINLNSNPYQCVTCNQTNGQYYNSMTNQCECNVGYYLVSSASQVCSPCNVNLCSQCNPSAPYQCLTCVVGAQLSPVYTCNCQTGLIENNGTCMTCNYKCNTCTVNVCNSCADSAHRNISNGCQCIDGYFDNFVPNCVVCSSNCKTCSSLNICTSCRDDQNKILSGGLCLCKSGFYPQIDNSNNIQCLKCDAQCDSCVENSYTCNSCDSTKNKVFGNDSAGHLTCICAPGYSMDSNGNCSQTDCTTDPYCSQCVTNSGVKICLACKPSTGRILNTNSYKCVCNDGYYQNSNKQCVSCPNACSTCSNSTYCVSCVAGADKIQNICSCKQGTFFTSNPVRYCQGCSQYCVSCSSNGSCSSCLNNFDRTADGKCTCNNGKYINSTSGECNYCSSECQTCQTNGSCDTCKNGYLTQNTKCVLRCDIGYYKSDLKCLKCSSGCTYCNASNNCLICQGNLYSFNGQCFSTCPEGTVLQTDGASCVACNQPCRTCITHPSRCTSCLDNSGFLSSGICTLNCPVGTYGSQGSCLSCSFSCASCSSSANLCTSCPNGKYLYNGLCYDYCPNYNAKGECVTQCPTGYYQPNNSICTQCSSLCLQCSSANQCSKCASTAYSYQGQCLSQCPTNTYNTSSRQCLPCDISCKGCSGSPYTCYDCSSSDYIYVYSSSTCVKNNTISCTQHQYKLNDKCVQCSSQCQTCLNSTYCLSCNSNTSPINGKCNICSSNCLQCPSNSAQCIQCANGYYLFNKGCQSSCPYPLNAINGNCQCSSGLILYKGTCLTACPSGYTAISSQCIQCDSNCKQCSEKIQYCTACPDNYQLNVASKLCEKVSAIQCPYGQYYQSGQCLRYCGNGLLYQNGLCYYTCLPSYVNNNQGGCVYNNSTQTICNANQFIYQNTCVSNCPQGFFGNTSSTKCESCPSNCGICLNSTTCTQCTTNYKVQNGLCIINTNNQCTSGYYYNSTYSICFPCSTPCVTCSDSSVCLSCLPQYNLVLGQCVPTYVNCASGYYKGSNNVCQICVSPCQTCSGATSCNSCITGYQLNGNSCNQIITKLTQLTGLVVQSTYRRDNSVIVSIILPVIPDPLTLTQKSQFFNVKQSNTVNKINSVTQWQDSSQNKRMWISVNFNSIDGSSFLFFSVSANIMSASYAQLGYSINEAAYKAASVYQTLPQAPNSIVIPSSAQPISYA